MSVISVLVWSAGCGHREPEPPPPGACGDGACAPGENQVSCARDCPSALAFDGDIDACVGDLEQDDIDDLLRSVGSASTALGGVLPLDGALAVQLTDGLVDVIPWMMADLGVVQVPLSVQYADPGRYETAHSFQAAIDEGQLTFVATSLQVVEYLLGGPYELGPEDTVVPHDLFERDNFVVDPSVSVDPQTGEVLLAYAEAGPLVELLGFGAAPPNPIAVGLLEVDDVGAAIPRLKMRSTSNLAYADAYGNLVALTVTSDPRRCSPLLDEGGFDWRAADGTVSTPRGRAWAPVDVALTYDDRGQGSLTGTLSFEVRGSGPHLDGTFVYDRGPSPAITLTCAAR
ncbi:MAG: hypothetical protein ABMA64_10970 [Myxococcota bacterium]